MSKIMYLTMRKLIRVFSRKMTTVWEEPFDDSQPAVFCPNHAGAMGPMEMVANFPLCDECRPWMNSDMMDAKKVPAYVRQDYWWKPGCKMEWLYNATLPYLAAAILPPILRGVDSVPVYHDMQIIKTFRKSIEEMKKNKNLIVFAEQPSGYLSHEKELNKGFLMIAPMTYRSLGIALKFYPVHIDYKNRIFKVGKPIQYQPEIPLKEQEEVIVAHISQGIRGDKC